MEKNKRQQESILGMTSCITPVNYYEEDSNKHERLHNQAASKPMFKQSLKLYT